MTTATKKDQAARIKKTFPVFDCDAHINDPLEIWTKYVEPQDRDLVKRSYWKDERHTILNGRTEVLGGANYDFPTYNPICIAGPQMNKRIMRRLQQMPLTPEQKDYLEHKGATNAHARIKEMDLMGIDQVLVIPTMMVAHLPYIESAEGAYAFARAYNNWAEDWCKAVPDRLFPAGYLPIQSPIFAADELRRIAQKKFPVALARPIDARGHYPNKLFPVNMAASTATMDKLFRTFEETQVVLGMHTFPAVTSEPSDTMVSPGELITKSGEGTQRMVDSQSMSFVFEGMTWLTQILLSGFLDRYPKLKMTIFESNASWLVALLERCDRYFKLYRNERIMPAKRTPTEAFYDQCLISFESDETPVFRQWDRYENIAIWASDCYHHDGADSWSAMREMDKAEVPAAAQVKMLGGNTARMYGIQQKVFVTEEPPPIQRPAWFPQGKELEQWWERESNPRKYGAHLAPSPIAQAGRRAY